MFRQAAAAAAAQARPAGDIRGPVEYKRAMAAELTVRSLRTAVSRAMAYA
jgi:carbon-monoxide dehydrogenase medium subunit